MLLCKCTFHFNIIMTCKAFVVLIALSIICNSGGDYYNCKSIIGSSSTTTSCVLVVESTAAPPNSDWYPFYSLVGKYFRNKRYLQMTKLKNDIMAMNDRIPQAIAFALFDPRVWYKNTAKYVGKYV